VVMGMFVTGTILLILSGVPGLAARKTSGGGERLSLLLVMAGSILGSTAVLGSFFTTQPIVLSLPWTVPGASFSLCLDTLSGIFLLPLYLVTAMASVYGLGYWPQSDHKDNGKRLRLFLGLMAGTMSLVLTARNGILFLAAWEIMALSGFFLITTEDTKEETRNAGFLYLGMTHAGTLALFAFFALLAQVTGNFAFPLAGSMDGLGEHANTLFLLAVVGFGIKAGLMPMHIWLPSAHAAAPSHVSALLSGVMIKMGIYGIFRTAGFFASPPSWWGWFILAMGAFSAVLGVAMALAQHDMKRLLAYHSVENIGIIAMGLGIALLGRTYGAFLPLLYGLSGALLHVVNHGLFKSLLFLGAGSVIHATGTRQIDAYGGLQKKMPMTALFFLGGAVAISGLPPLNGFVSEWMIYLGLFRPLSDGVNGISWAVLAAPFLALTGALAMACFVKAFGATFLGVERSDATLNAHESPLSMIVPMGVLLAACAAIGLFPSALLPVLNRAAADWTGAEISPIPLDATTSASYLCWTAWGLIAFIAFVFYRLKRKSSDAPHSATWGCGYTFPSTRMQYTASSFAGMLVGFFSGFMKTDVHRSEGEGLFPRSGDFAAHTPDTVLDRCVFPFLRHAARLCTWLRARLQHGISGIYLMYVALALGILLIAVIVQRG